MKKNTIYILLIGAIIVLISFIVVNYKVSSYSVNFYNEGNLIYTSSIRKNKTAKEPTPPSKEGYMFIGWYLDSELYNFETSLNESINLVAGWGKITLDNE